MNKEKDKKSCFPGILTALLIGLSTGFILGILFAPKSGRETEKEIKKKSIELIEKGKSSLDEFTCRARDYMDKSKSKLAELRSKGESFAETSKEKIADLSKVVSSETSKAGEKIKKVVDKGKKTSKRIEEELS